ncbi:MAG: hypothetical protein K9L56_15270 [Clostridiales bacterium]|nr:hypothetical protein [Clostridiales bacterium]
MKNNTTIETYPLKELIQERISDYFNIIKREGMFDNNSLKDIVFRLNSFDKKVSGSLLKYILLLDNQDYNIDISVRFYFKRGSTFIGYDTTNGELKRYEANNKIKIIDKLRGL